MQTRYFVGFTLLLALSNNFAVAGGFSETVTSVDLPQDPVVIASSGSRNHLDASCDVDIEQVGGGTTGTVYRVIFRLVDELGAPVPLANADTANGFIKRSAVQTVTAPISPPGTVLSRTFTAELQPATQPGLTLAQRYRLEAVVQQKNPAGNFIDQDGPVLSNAERIDHFKSTVSGDAALNTLAEITQVQFNERWLRGNDATDAFDAEVLFNLHRFDDFTEPLNTNDVDVVFEVSLHSDAPGTPSIPLQKSSWTSTFAMVSHVAGPPKNVFERNALSQALRIRPADGQQLASRSDQFFLRVTIRHDDGGSTVTGNTQDSTTDRLFHFNGTLFFDFFRTEITDIGNAPDTTLFSVSPLGLGIVLEVLSGESVNHPGYVFGDGSPINVELFNNGTALVLTGTGYPLTSPVDPDQDEVAQVLFKRSALSIDPSGVTAGELKVQLPTGMGYTTNRFDALQESTFTLPNQPLNANLQPKSQLLQATFANPIFVTEEAHPVHYETSTMAWDVAGGRFTFNNDAVHYVRQDEIDLLITGNAPADHKIPRSNELFYYYVANNPVSADIVVEAHTNRSARLIADLPLESFGNFAMHFPHDARINWDGGGTLSISNDLFTASSALNGITSGQIPYRQDCSSSGDCNAAAEKFAELHFAPQADRLNFTPDGGLYANGSLIANTNRFLAWGHIEALDAFAHRTDAFANASFVMGGVHLAPENSDGHPANGPGRLLLSGWDTGSGAAERPESAAYADGLQSYAGINLRVVNTGDHEALSTLGGTAVGSYDLTDRAKFYARAGGVSGILEADPGGFPGTTTIWGYPFDFSSFALSYLSNVNQESRTDGSLDLPDPALFTIPFDDLGFDCLGALTDADIAGGGPLRVLMQYWNADLDIHSIRFETPADCDPSEGYLVTGAGGFVHPLPDPLFGELGFRSTGNIITQADELVEGLDSRLFPPNAVKIEGPGDQVYAFTPVTGAWYDNHANLLRPPTGRINLAGMLDIPWFEDMRTHIRASTREADPVGFQELAGGWTQGGNELFFTTDFDPDNFGLPFGVGESAYLAGGNNDIFRMRARKEWWDGIVFDYPLVWNSVARTFRSAAPTVNRFLVIDTEHELSYLDAEQAEIVFGAQYEGLPQINLANTAYTAGSEQTGNLESLVQAANQQVADALVDGMEALDETLDDQYDEIVTELLDAGIQPQLDTLYDAIDDFYNPAVTNTVGTVHQVLHAAVFESAGGLNDQLFDLFTGLGSTASLLDALDDRVARGQDGLLAVMDESSFQGTLTGTLLTRDSSGEYLILRALADEVLNENAIALREAFGALDPLTAWDQLLGAIIKTESAGLENARAELRELYEELETIRTELDTAGALVEELRAQVSPESIGLIATGIVNDSSAYLTGIEAELYWEEYSEEEVKAAIRTAIDDQIHQSATLAELQAVVKHRLYDLEARAGTTIDSVFASVNQALRELTREYLTPVDNSWNDFADELNGIVRGADLSGYAHLSDDALRKIRMDLLVELNMVDPMTFHGYFELCEQSSDGDDGCDYSGGTWKEGVVGARGIPLSMVGAKNMTLNAEAKFTFNDSGTLVGLGGGLDLSGGELKFSGLAVETFGAAFMMGEEENYFGGKAGVRFNGTKGYGGMFFGRSCTLDPLHSIDPTVASIVGQAPFTGIYGYGEAHIPIINAGCFFNISVGAGLGAYLFSEGPVAGGRMSVIGSGKALCLANISGRADLYGGLSGNQVFFSGTGRFEGKGGICPLCIKFNKSVTFTYDDKWKVKF